MTFWCFQLLKLLRTTSYLAIQISVPKFFVTKWRQQRQFGNFNSQNDHEDNFFLKEKIFHFISNEYIKRIMAVSVRLKCQYMLELKSVFSP